jgi:hypothetical protein
MVHGLASYRVELANAPRAYLLSLSCHCGINFSVSCDRILDDGWHEASCIITQHEQGILCAPEPAPVVITEHSATWDAWGQTIADAARQADAYGRLEAQLRALK